MTEQNVEQITTPKPKRGRPRKTESTGRRKYKPELPPAVKNWYSVAEIAAIVGVGKPTIRNWIVRKGLPAVQITGAGRCGRTEMPSSIVRINIVEFEKWLDGRRIP